jgi:hypothetical protein
MKPIVWVRRVNISASTGQPASVDDDRESVPRFSLADKAAFAVLAAGLLALGGVLLAAGLALLVALVGGGVLIGAATVIRHRLFGQRGDVLRPGEIPPSGVVLPHSDPGPRLSGPTPGPNLKASPAPRAD